MILVVVSAGDPDRASEGLRAGLGLGLRDEPVRVVLTGAAGGLAAGDDPRIARALRTLTELGRPAELVDQAAVAELMRGARAVEVWSESGPQRVMRVGDRVIEVWREAPHFRARDGEAVDTCALVAQIFDSDVGW